MKLSDLIPSGEQINFVQGIEGSLLKRRRLEIISGIVALMGGLLQVLIGIVKDFEISQITSAISGFFSFLGDLIPPDFEELQKYEPVYEVAGIAILATGIGVYLLLKRSKFLLRESEEPFQYTFWINQFKEVQSKKNENNSNFKHDPLSEFLHLDLMERLNERIGRLSLLDEKNLGKPVKESLHSHIYIEGEYALRQDRKNELFIYVISRIRIGSPAEPSNLTYAINYPLGIKSKLLKDRESRLELEINNYEDIVERVYSSIATEIYKQIKRDLEEKISMFPTRYRRAVALYYEARDFAQSNTVDAYNHAIELYREAIRYYNISLRTRVQLVVIRLPFLWRLSIRFHHNWSRTIIEYSKCLIYRRLLSTLSGRLANPIYEIPDMLEKTILRLNRIHNKIVGLRWRIKKSDKRLNSSGDAENANIQYRFRTTMADLNYKQDSFLKRLTLKPSQSIFKHQKEILCDAYVTSAMAYYYLDAIERAKTSLMDAKAVAPSYCTGSALYYLTSALLEPDLEEKTLLLRHAVEKAPNFEIAQYLFSENLEMALRTQNQIDKERVEHVIAEYDKVTQINPGNIAVFTSQGYLKWLINDPEEAVKKFQRGSEVKSIIQHTFTGELNYGLARTMAQKGYFNRCYEFYQEAISSDPGVAASSELTSNKTVTSYYSYIGPTMLHCFRRFKEQVERNIGSVYYGFSECDFLDLRGLCEELAKPETGTITEYLANHLSGNTKTLLKADSGNGSDKKLARALAKDFTSVLKEDFFDKTWISSLNLDRETKKLLNQRPQGSTLVDLNRRIFEQSFPKKILSRKSNERANSILRDSEDKPLSRNTLDIIHSFVLNDFGNALLNYHLRFGDEKKLNEAIEAYESALEKNPSNKVVYLNLNNAYLWQRDQEKAGDILKEGEKYFNSWTVGQIALLKSEAERVTRKITDAVNELIEKKEQVSQAAENILESPPVEDQQKGQIQAKSGTKNRIATAEKGSITKNHIENLENNLDSFKKKRRADIFSKFEKIMNQTKLGALFKGLNIDHNGTGVDKLTEAKIDKDKLNESDIEVLQIWAQILSFDSENPWVLKQAKKLCRFIKNYHPDHFDATLILHEIFFYSNNSGDNPFFIDTGELQNLPQLVKKVAQNKDPFSQELNKKFSEDETFKKLLKDNLKLTFPFSENLHELNTAFVSKMNELISDGKKISGEFGTNRLSQRSKTLLDKELEGKDLMGLKRRILEELYHECLEPKEIKQYREQIRNMITFWLEQGDKTYASLSWAKDYLAFTFEEYVKFVEKSISKHKLIDKNLTYDEFLYNEMANIYRLSKDWPNAENALRKAIEINPNNAEYSNQLGLLYYRQNNFLRAIEHFESASKKAPEEAIYQENIGDSCRELKFWEKAKKSYEKAHNLGWEDAAYENKMGIIYYRQRNFKSAISHFRLASEKDPESSLYPDNLGDAYRELQDWQNAEEAYRKAHRLGLDETAFENKIGILYYRQANYQKALEYFTSASQKNKTDPVYFANMGDSYLGLAQWEDTRGAYQKAIKLDPENPEYYNKIGISHYRQGAFAEAVKYFKIASDKNPQETLYLENIGDSYLELEEWGEAKKAYEKTLSINPSNDSAVNKIGIVYYRQKEFEEAIEYFSKATQLNPAAQVYLNNIADAYNELGNFEEAKKFYDQALQVHEV